LAWPRSCLARSLCVGRELARWGGLAVGHEASCDRAVSRGSFHTLTSWLRRLCDHGPFTAVFNISGQPAISLPLGHSRDGLPIGVQIVAPIGREDLLIQIAAHLEQVMPWKNRRPASSIAPKTFQPGPPDRVYRTHRPATAVPSSHLVGTEPEPQPSSRRE